MLIHFFLFILLIIPSFIEGLGITADRRIFLLYFSTVSTFAYIYSSLSPKPIRIPLKAGVSFLSFLFLLAISTFIFSIDKQSSFEILLFNYSCFLFFVFFYNYKEVGSRFTVYAPIILGVGFALFSVFIPYLRTVNFNAILPVYEKQFVIASYGNHNHLGDALGLLLVILTYYIFQKKWVLIPLYIIFFIMQIYSFSRSANIALFFTTILLSRVNGSKVGMAVYSFLFLCISILVLITYLISFQSPLSSPFGNFQVNGKKLLSIVNRDTLSNRDIFLTQAINSIKKYPYFGVGGGNFKLVSQSNVLKGVSSDTAHNIFLELATEHGILALIPFVLFSLFIVLNIARQASLNGLLFIYLLINFQTDYTYQLYSVYLYWIILASVSYKEKSELLLPNNLYGVLSLIPLFIFASINTSSLLMNINKHENALNWYPFNKEVYVSAIKKSDSKTPIYIERAKYIAPLDVGILLESAEFHFRKGQFDKALPYYVKIYKINHLCSFAIIKKIYSLKKKLISQNTADLFLHEVVLNYRDIYISNSLKKDFANLCKSENIKNCPRIGTYVKGGILY